MQPNLQSRWAPAAIITVLVLLGIGCGDPKGKVLFVDATNLFKSDLKVTSPKAGSTVEANAKWTWKAYEGADHYKLSAYFRGAKTPFPYHNYKVDGLQKHTLSGVGLLTGLNGTGGTHTKTREMAANLLERGDNESNRPNDDYAKHDTAKSIDKGKDRSPSS